MWVDSFIHSPLLGRRLTGVAALLAVLLFVTSPVYAHKVHIFAYVDGDMIKTESRFNGGRPARNCNVEVQSLSGKNVVASGQSDEQGHFSFPPPSEADDLQIVISCGDGHRGSWLLETEEYGAAEAQATPHVHSDPVVITPHNAATDDGALRKIIGEEVEKKIAPLRRDLARLAERKTSLQDILAGIGYLLGLAGLAAYMRYKKSN